MVTGATVGKFSTNDNARTLRTSRPMILLAPSVGVTFDESVAEMCEDIVLALRRADLTNQQAALYMWGDNRHEAELSHALKGRRPLDILRMAKLPKGFWVHFLRLRAIRVGHEVVEHGVGVVLDDIRALLRNMKGEAA
jgi:hypothetical protein